MRRRDFVFGFSGAALAMQPVARAQQVTRVWRIGQVGFGPRDKVQLLLNQGNRVKSPRDKREKC